METVLFIFGAKHYPFDEQRKGYIQTDERLFSHPLSLASDCGQSLSHDVFCFIPRGRKSLLMSLVAKRDVNQVSYGFITFESLFHILNVWQFSPKNALALSWCRFLQSRDERYFLCFYIPTSKPAGLEILTWHFIIPQDGPMGRLWTTAILMNGWFFEW